MFETYANRKGRRNLFIERQRIQTQNKSSLSEMPDPLFDSLSNPDIDSSGSQIVPQQIFEAPEIKDGERRLQLAVLEIAVDDYKRCAVKRTRPSHRRFVEVHGWFFGPANPEWPYSFEYICENLNVNEDAIRRGLRQWREANAPDAFVSVPFVRRKKTSLQAE